MWREEKIELSHILQYRGPKRLGEKQKLGLQRFPISDFAGGLNTSSSPFELEPNEAQDLLNVTLSPRGALSQRAGKTQFDTAGFPGTKRVEHSRNWYPNDGNRYLICSIDGDIYSCDTGGVLTSRFDGTAGKVWCFEAMQDSAGADYLWAMNGTDTPKKFTTGFVASDWADSPPNGTMIRVWRNRMIVSGVAANPQRLFYSNTGDPESPAASFGDNWIDIRTSDDDLDPITWLEILGDTLLVFKKRSVYAIYDPVSFSFRRIGSPGCEDRFQSAVVGGNAYFFARDGVYATQGINVSYESDAINNWFPDHLNFAHLSKARMAASRDRRLYLAVPTEASYNDRLLELLPDLRARIRPQGRPVITSGPWVIHDLPVASMATFRPVNVDVLIGADANASKLHTLFEGTDDDGVAISSFWLTSWKSIVSEEPFERLRRVNLMQSGRVRVDIYSDLDILVSKWSATKETVEDADTLWDGGLWDGGTWDPRYSTQLLRHRPERRGRYHAVKFSNNELDKSFAIYAAELVVRGGKEH